MRNASKNTIKRVMRRAWASYEAVNIEGAPWVIQWNNNKEDWPYSNYFLFNEVGAKIYRMSHGKICNRAPKGYKKYYKSLNNK